MTPAVFSIVLASSAALPTDNPDPKAWLNQHIEHAHRLAQQPLKPGSDQEAKWQHEAEALLSAVLDWPELTKKSMGRHWRKLSEREKASFSRLLQSLIETSYQSRLKTLLKEKKEKAYEKPKIEWLKDDRRRQTASLEARVVSGGDEVVLGFKLRLHEGAWRMYDLSIDDLSTVRTYRSNFNRIILKEGFPSLLSRLESKIEDIKAGRTDYARPNGFGDLDDTP